MNLKKYVLILGLILASICFVSAISAASLDEMGQSDSSSDAPNTKELHELKNSVKFFYTAMKNNPQKVMKYGSESGNQNNTDHPSGSASNTQKNVAPFKNHKYPLFKNPKRFEPYLRLIFNIKRPQ